MIAANVLHDAQLRLARYYAQKLRQMNERFEQGGALLANDLSNFDQEMAQIRHWQNTLVDQGVLSPEHDRLLIEFALNILITQQPFDEQLAWAQSGLSAAQRLNDSYAECALLKTIGYALFKLGDLPSARDTVERALKLSQHLNDKYLETRVVLVLGQIMTDSGEFELAKQYLQHAIDLDALDTKSKIKINTWLGYMAYYQDDFDLAAVYVDDNIQLSRMLGDLSELANALVNRGMTYIDAGQDAEGIPLIQESLSLQRKLGEKNLIGHGLQTLVGYYVRIGALTQAQRYADEHLATAEEIGSPLERVWAHNNLAVINRERGDYQPAHEYLLQDQDFIATSNSVGSVIAHQYTLASVLLPLGKYAEAKALCLTLLADASPLLELKELLDLRDFLAQIALTEGSPGQAITLWREALSMSENQYVQQVRFYSSLANTYLMNEDIAEAQTCMNHAAQIETEHPDTSGMSFTLDARITQLKLYSRSGQRAAAQETLADLLNRVSNLEVIAPRLNTLAAASEYLAAHNDPRSIQLLSLIAHHPATPSLQRTICLNHRPTLERQFGSDVHNAAWEIGKTLSLAQTLTDLHAEFPSLE